ncbi:MAG: rhomboid family intramembrane serine protease [Roseiarcus sp.]|jgi:membrane associated rhomboid family serine protease|uniref:rhomboid family intramembrane serine protease n=1 Tax=Roseiarcus sp. TaxID=1969460 RepID=UPI003C2737E1
MSDFPPADGLEAPRREPIFAIPPVVVALIVALIGAYAVFDFLAPATQDAVWRVFAFVPKRLTLALWLPRPIDTLTRLDIAQPWTLITYAFLHGSWTHVLLNSVWLVAFGPPVAQRFGALRFLAFFALTAIAGALTHWAFYQMDFAPLIGASAADSGMMAAATRFIFEPGGPLGSPQGYSLSAGEADPLRPAPPLARLLRQRRPLGFIAIWMATNIVFGAGAQALGASESPIAWIAHIGGFVVGLVAFPLFDRAPTQGR